MWARFAATISKPPRPGHSPAGIRHQCYRVLEAGKTSAHDRKCAVVIVIAKKARLPSPHGIKITCLKPLLIDRFDIQVRVGYKVAGVFPILGVKHFGHGMCRIASRQCFQRGVEDGIPNNQVAILMVLVPAATPVSNNNVRFILPDCVTDCEGTLLVELDLGVRIGKKYCLCPEQLSCFLSGCTLHFTVLLNLDILRSSLLTQRETQQSPGSSALDLLCQNGSHGEEAVARMRRNRHDPAWSVVGRRLVPRR